ncbi:MAG: NAD(P)-binding domain-containing protein [Candidatus Lokiarchaeota archaeon]|nr:NAD(P)-binding domain-containing protein [Candidatus Lokiarchaeota archaeon]
MRDVKIYRESDVPDMSILDGKIVAFIGYGNQGRSQALNLRDHGVNVIVGNISDSYRERANLDGFETFDIPEAIKRADVIFLLIPDEIQCDVYKTSIFPFLKSGSALVFAHGYNIAFNFIIPPKDIDLLIIAPRMIGIGVRECYLNGEGYFSFIGVGQNGTGKAQEILLALTKGVGGLTKGALETNFKEETVLDLFTEQGFGPASSSMLMKPMDILLEFGIPAEAILIEMILSGKMKYTFNGIRDFGVINGIKTMEDRSQYGILSRTIRYDKIFREISEIQKPILQYIEDGGFAEEWEKKLTKLKFKVIKFFASRVGFGRLETKVRKSLQMPEVDLWAETPYPTEEEIIRKQEIKQKLEDFQKYPEF